MSYNTVLEVKRIENDEDGFCEEKVVLKNPFELETDDKVVIN